MEKPDLVPAPSHIVGPTWQRRTDGSFWLPDRNRTLGDAVVNWMVVNLRQPGGPSAGERFLPTDEQYRFLLWWYAIDENGRFVYRNGVLRRIKGWGKDPLVAAIALADLCGPVVFSHWGQDGMPVGKTHHPSWVQIAAVSQDQTRNTFSLFPAMISDQLKEEHGLDLNKTIIYSKNGGIIEGVTSSPLAMEGKRPTLVIPNEIQWWLESNDGHEMFNVIEGNVTKAQGGIARYLGICNAHRPGEKSVGERLWESYQAVAGGQAVDTGLLYDAVEAPADTPVSDIPPFTVDPEGFEKGLQKLREGLEIARGDALWLDIDTIIASILDVNNSISESRRKFLNQINAAEDSWITPQEWDAIQDEIKLQPKDRITLGFDGSKSGDWSALVACRIDDGAIFPIKVWNPGNYDGEVPREDVDATVQWAFGRYDVIGMRADVKEFEAYVDQWAAKYHRKLKVKAGPANPIAFDMRGSDNSAVRKRFAKDCERFLDAVLEGGVKHNGDKVLRSHVLNAKEHPTEYDAVTIRKTTKDSDRKIDAAVCAVMAFGLRQEFLMSKKNRSRKVGVHK